MADPSLTILSLRDYAELRPSLGLDRHGQLAIYRSSASARD
jgi:hypothetical protein